MNESYKAAGGEGDFYMVGEMLDEADKAAPYYRGLPALFEFTFWYKLKWALQNGIGCYFVKDILDVQPLYAPVSYTHLDVYKRQIPHGAPRPSHRAKPPRRSRSRRPQTSRRNAPRR